MINILMGVIKALTISGCRYDSNEGMSKRELGLNERWQGILEIWGEKKIKGLIPLLLIAAALDTDPRRCLSTASRVELLQMQIE